MSRIAPSFAPLVAVLATVGSVAVAPVAGADCNTVTNSTLCASGTVTGSSGAPVDVPYNPYPCYGTPGCDFYDIYNPGITFDLSPNRPRPQPR